MVSISRTPSIYQIRHIESGKVYVGSAVNPQQRCREHMSDLRNGVHHSRHLQHAWNKYGEGAFTLEIIEPVLFVEDLVRREQYWIDALVSADSRWGYNSSPTAGSPLGVKHTNEMRRKTSDAMKARLSDPAERARVSERSKAKWADPVIRAKMIDRARVGRSDPAVRAKVSQQQQTRMEDPAHAAKVRKGNDAYWADPANRAKAAQRTREQMANRTKRKKESS